MESLLGRLGRT